jgi:hypothetical protein
MPGREMTSKVSVSPLSRLTTESVVCNVAANFREGSGNGNSAWFSWGSLFSCVKSEASRSQRCYVCS